MHNSSSGEWEINWEDVRSKINSNTRVFMLNSPHNPTGKVFSEEEQKKISDLLDELAPNCIVLNDLVYESNIYDDKIKHIKFATIGDNWKRTLSIYSGGKMMCCTGWKVGWTIGPAELVTACLIISESTNFVTNVICQRAIARALPLVKTVPYEGHANYLEYVNENFKKSRDCLMNVLAKSKMGFVPINIS